MRDPRHTVTPHQAPYLVRISTYTLHFNFLTTLLHVQALLDQCVVALERRILRIVACQARVYLRHLIDPQRAIRCAFSSTIIIYPPCRAIILACEPAFAILVSTLCQNPFLPRVSCVHQTSTYQTPIRPSNKAARAHNMFYTHTYNFLPLCSTRAHHLRSVLSPSKHPPGR